MFKTRLKQWGLSKYCKAEERSAIPHSFVAREAEGTEIAAFVRGKRVSHARINKWRSRNKGGTLDRRSHAQDFDGHLSTSVDSLVPEANEDAQGSQGFQNWKHLVTPKHVSHNQVLSGSRDLLCTKNEEADSSYTPSELKVVELALLQTDYFYHDHLSVQDSGTADSEAFFNLGKRQISQSTSPWRLYQPRSPEQLRDLEQVLHQNDIYFHSLKKTHSRDRSISTGKITPTSVDALSKRFDRPDPTDVYNQYWLAMNFLRRRNYDAGSLLLHKIPTKIRSALKDAHPHFLSWTSFTICYQRIYPDFAEISKACVSYTLKLIDRRYGVSHPFAIIGSTLRRSDFKVEICEALLKQTIDVFRCRLSVANNTSVAILAKLYDLLSNAEEYDEQVAEAMKQWARCSQDVARQVHEEESSISGGSVEATAIQSKLQ
jgi:hypothetical protein